MRALEKILRNRKHYFGAVAAAGLAVMSGCTAVDNQGRALNAD